MRRDRALQIAALLAALAPWLPAGADPFDFAVPMQEHDSGQYYVHAVLSGGVETDFLVDTGSGYVALSKETFDKVRRQPGTEYQRDIVGAMANGRLMKVQIYRVAELAISDHCRLTDIEVAVFPSGARDILGLSALRRVEPFAMHFSPPELRLSGCVPAPPAWQPIAAEPASARAALLSTTSFE